MIDDTDTYIVRDILTDDLIFVTPEDIINIGNGDDTSYDNYVNSKNKQNLFVKNTFFFIHSLILK